MKTLKSVLLIEDDRDDQEFFIEALKEIANLILFDIADNGKIALDKLKNSLALPDIIFTDINMPVMDGIEWFLELKKNPRLVHIPVVFLSSDTEKTEMVCKLGAKGFLTKSFNVTALRNQLEKTINSDFMLNGHTNQNQKSQFSAY